MAKTLNLFGCSPPTNSTYLNDLMPTLLYEDYIAHDTFDNLPDYTPPSICSDIQKINSDMGGSSDCSSFGCPLEYNCIDVDMKFEICNTDLMWSQSSTSLGTSASSTSTDISSAVPPSAVMGNSQIKIERCLTPETPNTLPQKQQPTVVTARKFNKMGGIVIKQEPDVEQQLDHHSIPNIKVTQHQAQSTNMQSLPPGASLLLKSATIQQQQQKKLQQTRLHMPKVGDQLLPCASPNNSFSSSSANISLNTSSCSSDTSLYQRPDTPYSLDDDSSTTAFRHNVDLTACVMGSNNILLDDKGSNNILLDHKGSTNAVLDAEKNFINNVSQQLQDTSKKQIDARLSNDISLNEVMDFITQKDTEFTTTSQLSVTTSNYDHCLSVNTPGSHSSDPDSDEESSISSSTPSSLDHEIPYGAGGVSPVSIQFSNISSSHNYMQHSDHSYTRCKDGMGDMNPHIDTPSDSEDEIDVVSINDKKLPTNPSDRDRRALQTKVAHKFNSARVVKTPNGVRTIPPRRGGSYELPYTPVSNSPVKSVNSSRFPSPAATPYSLYTSKYVQQQQQQMMSVIVTDSSTGTPVNILTSDKSRKRILANAAALTNGGSSTISNGSQLTVLPPSKKHRGKKSKHVVTAIQLQPAGAINRSFSADETADTIEKRNLHNDMERQRRIGLKNLFEALKKQIPSIKDKERAPKVNILREAAKLCEALTREDQLLCEQKAKLKEELRRKQELVNQLRQQQRD
ncbi:myc protein [Stomoxys calcitrans]|uniref:BHLH domain-containing protein n=1 Tax=Stomoxys calcitrans TaxID=35570 RepID=A0A1I8Q4H0_STOCA|nr:myc protein [Stomoxys calcitrans]